MSRATVGELIATQYSETINSGVTNDNVGSFEPINDNDIEKYSKRPQKSMAEIDALADQLVEVFANPGARRYYCKVAMMMSEAAIWNNVELAKRGRSPARYFTWLCQKIIG